jgi:hypothetical protein
VTDVRWEGFSHAEIYRRVQAGPGRGASVAVESAWTDTEAVIRRIEERLVTAIRQAGGGWEGAAADATRDGLTPLGRWAADAAGDAKLTATGVIAQGEQAAWLRNAMPSPSAPLWDEPSGRPASDPLYLLEDAQALEQKDAEDTAQAVHLMNTYTSNSYDNIRLMNYWTLPPTVTVETAGGGGPIVTGSSAVGSGGGSAGSVAAAPVLPVSSVGLPGSAGRVGAGTMPPAGPGVPPTRGPDPRDPTDNRPATPGPGPVGPGSSRPAPTSPGVRPAGPAAGSGGAPGVGPATGGGVRPVIPGPSRQPGRGPVRPDLVPGPSSREPGMWPRPVTPSPGGRAPIGEPIGPVGRPSGVEPPVPGRGLPSSSGAAAAEPTRGSATPPGRPGAPSQTGLYPPMLGLGSGTSEREHRRPDYLLDDGGAFADDRWFPPPVIAP